MGIPEGIVEEAVTSKKVTIARNKAGRQAFMNNAPVDNFGTKEYQYVTHLNRKEMHTSYGKAKESKVTVSLVISRSSWTGPQPYLRSPLSVAVSLIFL